MNLQKKRKQDDATQMKKKSIALKGMQDEFSTNKNDDLACVIEKANKTMKKNQQEEKLPKIKWEER